MAIPRNLANIAPHVNASSTELVVNDGGANLDFRVEGDTDANLFFVDASADSIGIGTNAPNLTSFQKTVTLGNGTGTATRHAYEINGGQSNAENSVGDFNVYNKGSLISRMLTVRGSADNSGILTFYTSNAGTSAERMRITSDGYLRMASGSGGIQFNGDTAAGNALDDYEEGTWTAAISGVTSVGNAQSIYTKIGRIAIVTAHLELTTGSAPADTFTITGLPLTSASNSRVPVTITLQDATASFAQVTGPTALVSNSTTSIEVDLHGFGIAIGDRINLTCIYTV